MGIGRQEVLPPFFCLTEGDIGDMQARSIQQALDAAFIAQKDPPKVRKVA